MSVSKKCFFALIKKSYQVVIAKWLAWGLATGEVPGATPEKGDDY